MRYRISPNDPFHQPVGTPPRKRRGARRWLTLFPIVLAVAWFAPTLVALSGLRNRILPTVLPEFTGKLIIGSASVGWLSPIELRDVAVWDANNQPIARIPLLTSEKRLLHFLMDQQQLGTFYLHQPELQLVLTGNSSNIEQLLLSLAGGEKTDAVPSAACGFGISVTEGRVLLTDTVSGQACVIDQLELLMQCPNNPPAPLSLSLAAEAQQGAERGQISGTFQWQMPATFTEADLGDGQLQLLSNGFPLITIEPFLRRSESDLRLAGQLDADLKISWNRSDRGPKILGHGSLAVHNPTVDMPSLLGEDRLALHRVSGTLDVSNEQDQLNINAIRLHSDIADLTISGAADLREFLAGANPIKACLNWQSSHHFQIQGHIDVARVAATLPHMLRLRKDTQITQGLITLDLQSGVDLGQRMIEASLQTDQLQAVNNGRPFSWNQPLHLSLQGVSSSTGVEVRRLTCQSDFIEANAAGTLQQGTLQADCDLQRLASQLGRFCDLGDLQLAGRMTAEGTWQRTSASQTRGTVSAVIRELSASAAGMRPLEESELRVTASLDGVANTNGIERLDAATVEILSGEDRCLVELTQPMDHPTSQSTWPLKCELAGRSSSWLARLQPWVALGDWDIHAQIQAAGTGNFQSEHVSLTACEIHLSEVSVKGPGLLIREPQVDMRGIVGWQAARHQLTVPTFTFSSSALAARAENLDVTVAGGNTSARGSLSYRADLQRLSSWQYAAEPPTMQLRGQAQGRVTFATSDGLIEFQNTADVAQAALDQLAAASAPSHGLAAWTTVWSEPQLTTAAAGSYAASRDQLTLTEFHATTPSISVTSRGDLTQVTTAPIVDLSGELKYDLALLANKLRDRLGPELQLQGQESAPFTVKGPLTTSSLAVGTTLPRIPPSPTVTAMVPPDLTAETTIGWDALSAYGLALGPQHVTARLAQGTLSFSPLKTTLAEGTISLAPRIELNASPMMLVVDQGTVAEGIQITPEMFQGWFKYIAPILAGAATADGRMSIYLQGAQVPLSQPLSASLAGSLMIDGARVKPGPMAEQLLAIVTEVATLLQRQAPNLGFLSEGRDWLEISPQQVDFQMSQGRIYHRNLEFKSGEVTLRTQGWVGIDQTVGIMAEVPIQDEWIGKQKLLAGMQGQAIRIPIQGTLSRPQLERSAVAQLSRQMVESTAQNLLQEELQKGLQKLLGPK